MSKNAAPDKDKGKHVQKLAKMIKDLNKRSGDDVANIDTAVTENGLSITIHVPAQAINVSAGKICVDSRTLAAISGVQQTMC